MVFRGTPSPRNTKEEHQGTPGVFGSAVGPIIGGTNPLPGKNQPRYNTMIPYPVIPSTLSWSNNLFCQITTRLQLRGDWSLECLSFAVDGIGLGHRADERKSTNEPPFLCQTCSKPIGSWRLLFASSTQCLLRLWFKRTSE